MNLSDVTAGNGLSAIARRTRTSRVGNQRLGTAANGLALADATAVYRITATCGAISDTVSIPLLTGIATGTIATAAVAATATISFSANPSVYDADRFVINGLSYGFKISGVAPLTYAQIGATLTDTLNNMVTLMNSSGSDTAVRSGSTIVITLGTAGAAGNSTTLTKTGSIITVSGSTFTGGADAIYSTTIIGGEGTDLENKALPTLTQILGVEIRGTAGSGVLTSGSAVKIPIASGCIVPLIFPSGTTALTGSAWVFTASTAGAAFTLTVIGK